MSDDCLFCKIISGDIPGDIVEQTDTVLAFRDINPQANTHILIIHKLHIESTRDLNNENINCNIDNIKQINNINNHINHIADPIPGPDKAILSAYFGVFCSFLSWVLAGLKLRSSW